MQSIHDIIMSKRKFIGRKNELRVMEHLFTAEKDEWHILHIYGPAGVGKTVLLHQFQSINQEYFPVIYVNCHKNFLTVEDFLGSIHNTILNQRILIKQSSSMDIIENLTAIAKEHSTVVLILDGIDQCQEIVHALKDEFFIRLPVNLRVLTAGRQPFDSWQTTYGFESIVKNIQLRSFSKQEWTEYATSCGITDAHMLYQIGYISQGLPLAVTLICNWIDEHGKLTPLSEADFRSLMALFDKHLLTEEHLGGVNLKLLSLASLTYTFDQELLQYMMDQTITTTQFNQLCQSAFVTSHQATGWMVNNGIRWWLRSHIKERFPSAYEQYKQRAETLLEHRISKSDKSQKALKLELAFGKFFLQDTVFTQSLVYFGNQQPLSVRKAKEKDLPKLAKMYHHNLQVSPPNLEDLSHQEQYFQEIWQIDSDAFHIIEHEGQWLSFFVKVSLSEKMIDVFKRIPTTRKWIQTMDYNQNDLFYWIFSTHHPTSWEMVYYFMRSLFLPTLANRRVVCQLILPDQAKLMELLDFEYIPDVDYVTVNRLRFYYYQLDARKLSKSSAVSKEVLYSDWVALTKKILNHYTVLHLQLPLLQQCKQYLRKDLHDEDLIELVHAIINDHLQSLNRGNRQEKIQAQILQYAYIKRNGPHETVAALLDLASSTYYRQLKKLTNSIALILQSHSSSHDDTIHP